METAEYLYRRNPLVFWLLLAVSAVLIGVAFQDSLRHLNYIWSTKEEYGYGYIIPVLSLFLVWQRRDRLADAEFSFSWTGLFIILLGIFLLFLGTVSTTITLSEYGLVITILGSALALLGWNAFRQIAAPLALLFFMVPLPGFIYAGLSTKLQLVSSQLGVEVIRLFDISVNLEGNVIDLGTYKLQVVEACSGLRYLFPLMSLSFVAAYLYRVEFWKRAVLFLSSMPITVLMNSFRIGMIGVLVEYGGIEQAEGFLHYFEGWIIFMACMTILLLEMVVMAKIGRNRKSLSEVFFVELPGDRPEGATVRDREVSKLSWSLPLLLALGMLMSQYIQERDKVIPDRRVFAEFPMYLGGWKGRKDVLEDSILESLRADDYIMSNFSDEDGNSVNFYIAYYSDQSGGDAAHSPRACLPGGGWQIRDISPYELDGVLPDGRKLSVNRVLIKHGEYAQIVYYWFSQRGRNIRSEWMVKLYLFWDSLWKNRTDGALVRYSTLVRPDEDVGSADNRLQEFVQLTFTRLGEYIPG